MELKANLAKLYELEEQIEAYYINLAELEINGFYDSLEYNNNLRELKNLTDIEKQMFIYLNDNYHMKDIKKEIHKIKPANAPLPICLGHLSQSYPFRLLNIFDDINEDDLVYYAGILKNDINKDIEEDLIYYKYNLIYMDYSLEDNFLKQSFTSNINLEANNYRTEDMPSYIFVDKSILVLDSYNYLNYLQSISDHKYLNQKVMLIIAIIELFARFILCDAQTLDLIYPEFQAMLESDLTSEEVKLAINDMENILSEIKSFIGWAR